MERMRNEMLRMDEIGVGELDSEEARILATLKDQYEVSQQVPINPMFMPTRQNPGQSSLANFMQSLDPNQAAEMQAQMNDMTQEQREEYLRFMSERHERMQHLNMMQQYTSLRKKMRDNDDNESDEGDDSFDAQALYEI